MPHRRDRRRVVAATSAIAAAHAYLGTIGHFELLSYTRPSKYPTLEFAQNDFFWGNAHWLVAILLIIGMHYPSIFDRGMRLIRKNYNGSAESWLCSISFTVMLVWGFFNLMAGLTATEPVALAAPGLAMVVALGSHLLANRWMQIKGVDEKGR